MTQSLPSTNQDLLDTLRAALDETQTANAGLRRKTLAFRNTSDPADCLSRTLNYCHAVAREAGTAPLAQTVFLDYGSWVYEECDLDRKSSLAWVQGILDAGKWSLREWSIGTPPPITFTHEYKSGGTHLSPGYPHHWFRTRFQHPAGHHDGPLLRPGLPAYPD